MRNLHIPSFIILGISVFCVSAEHYELACAVQRSWTLACVIFIVTYALSVMCIGRRIIIPMGKITKTVCVVGILEILYSIVQLFGLVPDNYRYAPFSGSLNNPAVYGMYLSFCMPMAVYYSIRSAARERNAWRTLTVVFVVFIFLSCSRTAILASLSGAVLVLMMEREMFMKRFRSKKKQLVVIGCMAVFLIALYFCKRESADGRLLIWTVCLEMIKDKPWTGCGFDGYMAQYMNYQADYLAANPESPYVLLAGETQNSFNEFLRVAVLYGIPCAVVFVGVLVSTLLYIGRRAREFRSVLLAMCVVFVVWCLFSYPLNIPFVWLIMLFVYLSLPFPMTHVCVPRCSVVIVLTASMSGLGMLGTSVMHDIRRILLQECAAICCDDNTMKEYMDMYEEYADDYQFIYNYGVVLHQRGEYMKSAEVFKQGSRYLSDYNMMLLLGDDYQKLKQYDHALACYKRAWEMVPSRYLPLYYSMRVYMEIGDTVEARKMANAIIHKQNKIKTSRLTRQVVMEAEKFLTDY